VIPSKIKRKDNRVRRHGFEIRLRATQFAFVLGITGGCMALAFYFGFNAGQKFGFEMSSVQSLAQTARLPIVEPDSDDGLSEDLLSDVYAKLAGIGSETEPVSAASLRALKATDRLEQAGTSEIAMLAPEVEPDSELDLATEEIAVEAESPRGEAEVEQKSVIASLGALHRESEVAPDPSAKASVDLSSKGVSPPPVETSSGQGGSVKVPRGWYAQVAAPQGRADAEGLSSKLREFGFISVIEEARVRDQSFFRVLVGPESSRLHAERLVAQLKREPYIEAEPFVRSFK